MTDVTTMDILKILPFDEDFKKKLFDDFDSLSPDQQYAIEDLIWDTYDSLCRMKLDENIDKAHQKAKESQIALDENFYNKVKEETEKELEEELTKGVATADLSTARTELEQIIQKRAD